MTTKDTAIIVPVYNEETVITEVVSSLKEYFKYIICVDDGSSDRSAEKIYKAGCFLVAHPINMGQGAAIQTGVEFAKQFHEIKYFVTFDADGQHRIEDVNIMIKEIKKNKYDILLGSRFLGSTEGIGPMKKIILNLAIKFSNITTGLKLTDTHNGLRVFNRNFADSLQIKLSDMAHASEIIEMIANGKFMYKEIPVTIRYTDYSRSKGQSIVNAVNIAFDTILRKVSK